MVLSLKGLENKLLDSGWKNVTYQLDYSANFKLWYNQSNFLITFDTPLKTALTKSIDSQPQLLCGDICNFQFLSKREWTPTYIRVKVGCSDVDLSLTSMPMVTLSYVYIHFMQAPSAGTDIYNKLWYQYIKAYIRNLANYIHVQL